MGGLATTGLINGQLRASWMAKASLIREWQPGSWGMPPEDPLARFYGVSLHDGPGSPAYVEWADAVALGAEFIDLDGDRRYDPGVDRPPLVGEQMFWTVYNDGTPMNVRTPRLGTPPMGLEIHQTVWGFSAPDPLNDVLFFHFRIINVDSGAVDSLIFSIWVDPDLGDYQDDLIGCDSLRNLGYAYNDGDDGIYGPNPPAFGIQVLQGAVVDAPGDTAIVFRGGARGVDTLVNKRSLPMTSFITYFGGDPILPDPMNAQIARNYQIGGLDRYGNPIDPTQWGIGGTPQTNPRYFYSGNPVTGSGWRDNLPADKRFLVNSGPFDMAQGDTQDIVIAYVVAQGSDALNSVTRLRQWASFLQQYWPAGRTFYIAVNTPVGSVDSTFIFDPFFTSLVPTDSLVAVHWQLLRRPPGSAAQIVPGPHFQARLEPDLAGDYTVRAMATLNGGVQLDDTLTVTAVNNHPPTARLHIQPPVITFGNSALADARASSDPDGDSLHYQWMFPEWVELLAPDTGVTVEFRPTHTGTGMVEVTVRDPYFARQARDSFTVAPRILNLIPQVYRPEFTHARQIQYVNGKIYLLERPLFPSHPILHIFDAGFDLGTVVSSPVPGIRFLTDGHVLASYGEHDRVTLFTIDSTYQLHFASDTLPAVAQFGSHVVDLGLDGSRLYLPILRHLHIYDISDPANPVQTGDIPLSPLMRDVAFQDALAAVAMLPSRVLLIDLASASGLDTLEVSGTVGNVEFGGTNVYALNGFTEGNEIQIIDASQPTNLRVAATITVASVIPGAYARPIVEMVGIGDYLLLGLKDGMIVYDCFDPNYPVEVAHFRTGLAVPALTWQNPQFYIGQTGDPQFGAGYYVFDEALGIDDASPRPTPRTFRLFQNFPNPFNPATTIRFALPDVRFTTLKVYDLLGREIKTLINRRLTPGEYTVQWDGTDASGAPVSSGVYFYRLTAKKIPSASGETFVQTRKMVLLR
ncbi:MAG: T9SS C-terminal target domain-containing protein [Calditrichaeota bacterium]|nr:MAG: T9SS C-terminal target domain-containing protein [Calditrichota bacterium]